MNRAYFTGFPVVGAGVRRNRKGESSDGETRTNICNEDGQIRSGRGTSPGVNGRLRGLRRGAQRQGELLRGVRSRV